MVFLSPGEGCTQLEAGDTALTPALTVQANWPPYFRKPPHLTFLPARAVVRIREGIRESVAFSIFLLFVFNHSMVALQCCVSFFYTTQWISCM